MAIKVNDFSIQAKVIQTCGDDSSSTQAGETANTESSPSISPSMKKEIIDECLEKVRQYLSRETSRY